MADDLDEAGEQDQPRAVELIAACGGTSTA